MGTNFICAFTGASTFDPTTMNSQAEALDQVLTYMKNLMMSCGGVITFENGTLAWSGEISIFFTNNTGTAIHNVIPAGQITLSPNEYAYVMLDDTDGTSLTVRSSAYASGMASQMLDYNKLVLGYYDSGGAFFASPNLIINGANLPASPGQGDLLYYNGSAWTLLLPGTIGQVLTTKGTQASPEWTTPATGIGFPESPNQGNMVFYNGSDWVLLPSGAAGQVLTSEGAGQNPEWATPPNSSGLPSGPVQGDLVYYNGLAWVLLPPGTLGQVLTTAGAGANPAWTTVSGSSDGVSFAKSLVLSLL